MHFKDKKNNLHFIDDASFIHLLPSDCVEITDEEAAQLLVITAAQLAELEVSQVKADLLVTDMTSIRAMREYIASKADAPQILKDRETLAEQLRAKLK